MAIICSILTVIGFVASPAGGELWKVIFNRALALFALIQRTRDHELVEEQLKALQIEKEIEIQEER